MYAGLPLQVASRDSLKDLTRDIHFTRQQPYLAPRLVLTSQTQRNYKKYILQVTAAKLKSWLGLQLFFYLLKMETSLSKKKKTKEKDENKLEPRTNCKLHKVVINGTLYQNST